LNAVTFWSWFVNRKVTTQAQQFANGSASL